MYISVVYMEVSQNGGIPIDGTPPSDQFAWASPSDPSDRGTPPSLPETSTSCGCEMTVE